jgi:hypothetical protein
MTLMPVVNISVRGSSWSSGGGSRWIGHRSVTFRDEMGTSSVSPRALNTCPLVTSPTGTSIGAPVLITSAPRTMPSVGCIEIVRTMSSPMCCSTSSVSVCVLSPNVTSTCSA